MSKQRIKDYPGKLNTPESVLGEQVAYSIGLQLPQMQPHKENNQPLIIACGGPSLKETLPDLRKFYDSGIEVVTVNNAHDYLHEVHITPAMHIQLDARKENAAFVKYPIHSCKYMIASQCHPDVFKNLEGHQVFLYHCPSDTSKVESILKEYYRSNFLFIEGGSTVTLRGIMLCRMLGFKHFEIFGFDSCFMNDEHHAYGQELNDRDGKIKIFCGGREFVCAPWMAKQAEDFMGMVKNRGDLFKCRVHGDGLIAHMLKTGAELIKEEN